MTLHGAGRISQKKEMLKHPCVTVPNSHTRKIMFKGTVYAAAIGRHSGYFIYLNIYSPSYIIRGSQGYKAVQNN